MSTENLSAELSKLAKMQNVIKSAIDKGLGNLEVLSGLNKRDSATLEISLSQFPGEPLLALYVSNNDNFISLTRDSCLKMADWLNRAAEYLEELHAKPAS